MTPSRRLRSEAGYSLIELLIASAIMLTVTGAIFGLMNPSQGIADAQPQVADLQQRMRVAQETIFRELVMVGAGVYQGPETGSLIKYFAPLLPRRYGNINGDGPEVFRDDTITLTYIPNTYSQTTISQQMPPNSSELKVSPQPNCPKGQELCGFTKGMVVVIFDTSGNFDMFEITEVQDPAAHFQHRGSDLNHGYNQGASVTQVTTFTLYRNAATNQLMRYDGGASEVAIADDVVDLDFSYFGDPNPPRDPKPILGEANCLYDTMGSYIGPPVLTPNDGSLVELTPAMLTDGPYCGTGMNAFDPDLLRIRKIRASVRLQVSNPMLRGSDTLLWLNPGQSPGAERSVPDYAVTFEVSPRNLNLAR
jgi:hypothetical protein